MKANAAQARAALDRPDLRGMALVLLHGPDVAGAAALGQRLAAAMGRGAERVDLDGATLRSDPARLADEAASPSLFGGARWIRVSGGEEAADAVAALLDADVAGTPVLVLAPAIKATGRLAKLVLAHARALAHACYPLAGAELERRAAELARERGLRAAPPAVARLVEAAGGDQAVLARELDKLALYLDAAPDRPAELTAQALDALVAERGEAEGAALADALVARDPATLGAELARLRAEGASPVSWLRQLQRRLLSLAAMRAGIDRGEPAGAVMKRHRVFFREEAATAAALARWTTRDLGTALAQVRAAERAVTAPSNAGPVLAEAAALSAARARRR